MNTPEPSRRPPGLLRAIGGLIVWSVFFVAVYAVLSVGCAAGIDTGGTRVSPRDPLTLLLAALFVVHLSALGVMLRRSWHGWRRCRRVDDERGFVRRLTVLVDAAALLGVLWVGFPLLLLPPCP